MQEAKSGLPDDQAAVRRDFREAVLRSLRSDPDRMTARRVIQASRAFLEQREKDSWRYVASTLTILGAGAVLAGVAPWWPLRLAASVLTGLVLGRTFILYHDFMHGAILRESLLAKVLMYGVGLIFLAPPRSWRESHNYHHANVARLDGPAVGAFPIMSVAAWRGASRLQRFRYRFSRHPLTIAAAYFTIFAFTMTIMTLVAHPRRNWDSAIALLLHASVIVVLSLVGGASLVFFSFLLPFAIAAALGAYLFYAQHSTDKLRIFPASEWTFYRAALESSSFMRLGPIMTWFLGNIGYHHAHHLNPAIPFYRLPDAMASIPELQHPTTTSLHPRDVLACLRANLWDQEQHRMVSYREAARATGAHA